MFSGYKEPELGKREWEIRMILEFCLLFENEALFLRNIEKEWIVE